MTQRIPAHELDVVLDECPTEFFLCEVGMCLAPGFLNDHSGQFAWIPFECEECFHLVLCTQKTDNPESLYDFIKTLQKLYTDAVAFPL